MSLSDATHIHIVQIYKYIRELYQAPETTERIFYVFSFFFNKGKIDKNTLISQKFISGCNNKLRTYLFPN